MRNHGAARGWTRRAALQALAVGAGAASVPRVAGAPAGPPRRIVFLFIPNGLHDERGWETWMKPGATPAEVSPGEMAAPLAAFRDQLVVFDGIDMIDDGTPADTHAVGQRLLLTAASRARLAAGAGSGISVDQHLAQALGRHLTPEWPSLEL